MIALCLVSLAQCNYNRMKDQASVRTYKEEMPDMDSRTVPLTDGFQVLKTADPKTLRNPLPTTGASVSEGKKAYLYYCVQCHGPQANGAGTVGQSFSPLPSDLKSADVQSLTDGELYSRIRLGYQRHPTLYTTIPENNAWAVVNFIRTLRGG
jgi:mono/diheme cytochrome c family protein